jgi:hypothetical protein
MAILCSLLLTLTTPLWTRGPQAGSIFSAYGQGEMILGGDARLRGMGGTGLALTEGSSGSLINPALLGGLKVAGITLTARPEALYVEDEINNNVLTSARVLNFALCLPMGKGLALSIDLRQLSDVRFKAYQKITLFEEPYTKAISLSGGLSMVSVNLAQSLGPNLAVGIRGGHIFGRTSESRSGHFENQDFRDSKISFHRNHSGTQFSAGIALKASERLSAGAFITPAYDVRQEETRSSSFTTTINEERTLSFPIRYGIGIAGRWGSGWSGQLDIIITQWEDFSIDGQSVPDYRNVARVALGGQYRARQGSERSYLRQIPLRFGYALEPWYQKTPDGSSIAGHFFTLGLGLPFSRGGAVLDAALELGWRGDVASAGAKETIVRGYISVWGFEPWFQRQK